SFESMVCNDDSDGGPQSQISITLAAGDLITIVVDGFSSSDAGEFTVHVNLEPATPTPSPRACPDSDLGSVVPVVITSPPGDGRSPEPPSCFGTGGEPERTFAFTAPHDGMYLVDSPTQPAFRLYARDSSCGGPVLSCSPVAFPRLTLRLAAGQRIVVVVESL